MDIGRERSTMNVALWIIQGLLAALFLFAGGAKLVMSADQMAGPVALPVWFLRFIGVAEVLGATVVMWAGGMVAVALMNLVVALLAAFVAYGRSRLAPYRDSSRPSVLRRAI